MMCMFGPFPKRMRKKQPEYFNSRGKLLGDFEEPPEYVGLQANLEGATCSPDIDQKFTQIVTPMMVYDPKKRETATHAYDRVFGNNAQRFWKV